MTPKTALKGPRHIQESLFVLEKELDESKRRHPTSYGKDDDPHPVKEHRGEGWRRLWHNVILFERHRAS
jgi:hypothetical protein